MLLFAIPQMLLNFIYKLCFLCFCSVYFCTGQVGHLIHRQVDLAATAPLKMCSASLRFLSLWHEINQGYQGGSCWGNDGNGLSTAIMITLTHISNTVELKFPFVSGCIWCDVKTNEQEKKQKEMYSTKLNSSSVGNLGCKWLCANCHHVKKWLHKTLVVLSRSNLFGPPEFYHLPLGHVPLPSDYLNAGHMQTVSLGRWCIGS